jgi:methionyl-tRNA synthetase
MDLRVGKILEASKIKKTNKLLLLKVDLGSDTRTVVSGIAKDYIPEDLIGVEVVLLCNLKPRLLRGVESQGMILMTKDQNGKMIFISSDSVKQAVPGLKIS